MLYESNYYGVCPLECELTHHGKKGQKWGVKNGPPYPLSRKKVSGSKKRVSKSETNGLKVSHRNSKYSKKYEAEAKKYPIEKLEDLEKLDPSTSMDDARSAINDFVQNDRYENGDRLFNCLNCSVAKELVDRGYSVQARSAQSITDLYDATSYFKGAELKNYNASGSFSPSIHDLFGKFRAAMDKTARQPNNVKAFNEYMAAAKPYMAEIMEAQRKAGAITERNIKSQGAGARGIIIMGWLDATNLLTKRSGAFHAFNYEVGSDGNIKYYDTQSSKPIIRNGTRGNAFYFEADPRELHVIRTDNLELSPRVTEAVYSYRRHK